MVFKLCMLLTLVTLLVGANSLIENECIQTLILTAVTSGLPFGQTDARFNLLVTFKTGFLNLRRETVTYLMYDHPDYDDARHHKGDTWYFERSSDESCMRPKNILSLKIQSAEGFDECHDAWNVETVQVFAKMRNDTNNMALIALADQVNQGISYGLLIKKSLTMDRSNILSCSDEECPCIQSILIYTTTSRDLLSGTDGTISLTLGYYGYNNSVPLYDRVGNDFERAVGDIWYYDISEFFSDICVSYTGIDLVRLSAETNDGVKLADAFVTAHFRDTAEEYGLVAADSSIEEWVDGDSGVGYLDIPLRNTCSD